MYGFIGEKTNQKSKMYKFKYITQREWGSDWIREEDSELKKSLLRRKNETLILFRAERWFLLDDV